MPNSFFSSSSSGIMVSMSGTTGASVAATRRIKASLVIGAICIVRITSKLLPRSARDSMSPLPTNGSSAGAPPCSHWHRTRARNAEPACHIRDCLSARLSKLRREQQEQAEHRDLNLEVRQRGPEIENAIGDQSGNHCAVRHRQRGEGVDLVGKKTQAADAVRMGRNQAQVDA